MVCGAAWGFSVFHAELKQGNCGVRNVSCPAVHFPEERWSGTKSSCAEAVLCDRPKSKAAMVLLYAEGHRHGKQKQALCFPKFNKTQCFSCLLDLEL